MRLVISSGHGKYVRGASGYLDEVDEARRVVEEVAGILTEQGHQVETFHDDTSNSQNENLNTIVNYHNSQTRDLDVSVHFNAYETTSKPMGCECLYVTQSTLAGVVSDKMASSLDLPDRGAKYRSDLFFLNSTTEPAVLLEVCFVDSIVDAEHYHGNFEALCHEIAEGLVGQEFDEPAAPPLEENEGNFVKIGAAAKGDVAIYVNGSLVSGNKRCANQVRFRVKVSGEVTLIVNGEEFHNAADGPAVADNHKQIEATVFGGSDDPNYSAYPPYDANGNGRPLGDTELYVALPYSFDPNDLPKVRVTCGELSAEANIADKGPWTTDDVDYVMGSSRPIAEICYEEGTPLPSGPNAGRVPTNKAGIDLSPALAKMIGVDGKGIVDWRWA
jgi:N-acetylmuramoyl-L-alanine amidase